MLRSMTGFGKTSGTIAGKIFSVEVRSLNGRYLDLNLKIPSSLREKEFEIRSLLAENIIRGKAELIIEPVSESQRLYAINKNVFKQYFEELESLSEELGITGSNLMDAVMKIPDVLASSDEKLTDDYWPVLLKLIEDALKSFNDFRKAEGKKLAEDILMRIQTLKKSAQQISATEANRKDQVRERLKQRLSEAMESPQIDTNRLEQEILYYSERLDITEELVRLSSHCDYFIEVMKDKEDSKGKKLGFIAQELGREVNTIGSKANDANIQKIAVVMKEELEKIKEQVNNVL